MYAILDNGRLIRAPRMLDVDDNHVYNPNGAQLRAAGYKLVTMTDQPATDPGFHAESHWEDREDDILQEWVIVEDSDDLDDSTVLEILLGGIL